MTRVDRPQSKVTTAHQAKLAYWSVKDKLTGGGLLKLLILQ
jgi:hypothetical protein